MDVLVQNLFQVNVPHCILKQCTEQFRRNHVPPLLGPSVQYIIIFVGNAVKTTWTKLRNCFFNAQKRRKTKSGQAATKLVKWKYEKEMEFLLPYLETRQTHTNLDEQTEELNDVEDDDADHETAESQEEHELSVNNSLSGSSFDSGLKKQTPRRSQTSNPAQEMVKILKENAELRRSRYQKIPKSAEDQSTLDEIDMFYLSMAKTVKRLPPIEQATIRMKLCTMISEAEIRQMRTQTQSQIYRTHIPLTSPSSSTSTASTANQLFSSPPPTPISQNNYGDYAQVSLRENVEPAQDVPMQYTAFQQDPSTSSYYSQ